MIDARSLHEWLKPKVRFNDWISRRLDEYDFQDGEDFHSLLSKTRGRPRKDYHLTIGMAKELAMVERTEVGRATRRYFIQMEQAALKMATAHVEAGTPEAIPQDFFDARSEIASLHAKLDRLVSAMALPAPKDAELGPLPPWVTAQAAVDRLGLFDPRLPASAMHGLASKVGAELTSGGEYSAAETQAESAAIVPPSISTHPWGKDTWKEVTLGYP
ncbi:hypothetical protein NRB_26110 [Novosphingobium sp. 11B]